MSFFYEEYLKECENDTDIYQHLPILYEYGLKSNSIVEFGVGFGRSTTAFMATLEKTGGTLDSFDKQCFEGVYEKFATAKQFGLKATFHLQDIRTADVPEIDMLLVDSLHVYDQVEAELRLHGNKVKKYIAFHDTHLFGETGQFGQPGINRAISEWRALNPEWKTVHDVDYCNGMLILERK